MGKIFDYDGVPVLHTTSGDLKGYFYDGVYIYKGIPYAYADRFQMPVPSKWNGVKDATNYGFVCPLQNQDTPNGELMVPHRYWPQDEHCQSLNIWTNKLDPEAKKPVLVWFHGGGYAAGSSIEQVAYDGVSIAKKGDSILVSVNHRLNILGYLDLSPFGEKYKNSANAGHADMVAALQWVHDNIALFGGDPENVTIFGQSGGGMKVIDLMQIPSADGLFQKGLVMSGVMEGDPLGAGEKDGTEIVTAMMKELGFDDEKIVLLEDAIRHKADDEKLKKIRRFSNENDPLYIIFTSGSTGNPKGVMTSHHSLMCYIEAYTLVMRIDDKDILGNQSPLDYIAAIRDIYIPLLCGSSTVIIPKMCFSSPAKLFDFMNEKKITSVGWSVSALTVPVSLGAFEHGRPEYLKKVCFSGSVMPGKCLKQWQKNLPDTLFVNQYGPTEATASCTYHIVTEKAEDDTVLPIGLPYKNYRVFLLNEDGTATKQGAEGEICVSGPILALGYYNDPERTAASFIQNPLNKAYNELIYKTGDIGVMREDGVIEFHGRMDRQIKHLGHRVELDEVELAAGRVDGVNECSVVYNKEKETIWLFYTGMATVKEIAVELRKYLPGFMVPRKIKNLEEIPRLPNGKIDINTLKAMSNN